ncbi:MAG: hypothetical protein RIQ94_2348 [Pseudomonadota bacterium]
MVAIRVQTIVMLIAQHKAQLQCFQKLNQGFFIAITQSRFFTGVLIEISTKIMPTVNNIIRAFAVFNQWVDQILKDFGCFFITGIFR